MKHKVLRQKVTIFLSLILLGATALVVFAQGGLLDPQEEVARQKEQILANSGILPGELFAFEGESLFYSLRGSNNLSMEACDFGLGAGVVDGAFAQLPRYFADTARVEDVDSRIVSCMRDVQGITAEAISRSEVVAIASYIAMQSSGSPMNIDLSVPEVNTMYEAGEVLWYLRMGELDMSCAVCHEDKVNKRIRLQGLVDVKATAVATHWPAYRFSNDVMWTMEDRIRACWNNVSVTPPSHYSDPLIALEAYMAALANGNVVDAPGFVR
ncbi:MAG: sulfur oxidation c-type cytochrome SoxA [Deinococcales bacterium]